MTPSVDDNRHLDAALPSLSVITITLNDISGLRRTVESVADQRGVDIEHIVVDGGSNDGTCAYLGGIEATINLRQEGRGRYGAMNQGMNAATGEYVWFMHSADTFASPQSARFAIDEIVRHQANWGYGLSRVVRHGIVVAIGGSVPFNRARFILGQQIVPHQAAVFKRAFCSEVGPFDEMFGIAEDQRWFVRASERADPAAISEFLCNFDGNGIGSARSAFSHYYDMWRARRREGTRIGGSRILDVLATLVAGSSTVISHQVGSLLRGRDE